MNARSAMALAGWLSLTALVACAAEDENVLRRLPMPDALTGAQFLRVTVLGTSEDDLWLVGPTVSHFDGSKWSEVPVPAEIDGQGGAPFYELHLFATAGRGAIWVGQGFGSPNAFVVGRLSTDGSFEPSTADFSPIDRLVGLASGGGAAFAFVLDEGGALQLYRHGGERFERWEGELPQTSVTDAPRAVLGEDAAWLVFDDGTYRFDGTSFELQRPTTFGVAAHALDDAWSFEFNGSRLTAAHHDGDTWSSDVLVEQTHGSGTAFALALGPNRLGVFYGMGSSGRPRLRLKEVRGERVSGARTLYTFPDCEANGPGGCGGNVRPALLEDGTIVKLWQQQTYDSDSTEFSTESFVLVGNVDEL